MIWEIDVNRTKRILILIAAILNLLSVAFNVVMVILLYTNYQLVAEYEDFYYILTYSTSWIYTIFSTLVSVAGSVLLFYSIRSKGKYFRASYAYYYIGTIIVIFTSGYIPWILLLIAMFIPDVILNNNIYELRQEQKEYDAENKVYEEKKRKIEELQKLRDEGAITEEEYKEKLFELL